MDSSTREKILTAGAKIIANEGIEAISIRYLCQKVGVKAPTVYYYFNDKEGLLDAIIDLAYLRHSQTYFEFIKGKSSTTALIKTWDSFFAFVENEPELFHAIVIAHLKKRIPAAGTKLFESIAGIFKNLEDKNKLKLPYSKSAEIFYAAAYGQALVYVSQNMNKNLTESIQFTRDLCLRGLLVEQ